MSTRRILKKKQKVVDLLNQIVDLEYEEQLKGPKRFEQVPYNKGTEQNPIMVTATMMYWNESIVMPPDRPDLKPLKVERAMLVEVDGKRCDHLGRALKRYTLEDIS